MIGSGVSVRLNDHVSDRNITAYVKGLKYKITAPGGFHSASCTVLLPYRTLANLGPADRLYVYESRSGATLWEGSTDNPGALAGVQGQSFELSAMGPMARASDERRAVMYIDADLQLWQRSTVAGMPASATAEIKDDPTAVITTGGLVAQFPPGNPIATNMQSSFNYSLSDTDMTFGAIYAEFKGGKTDAGYTVTFNTAGGPAPSDSSVLATNLKTAPDSVARVVLNGAGHPPAGRTQLAFCLVRIGGTTNVADDTTWVFLSTVRVLGRRMNRYGVLASALAGMQSFVYVRADWVVEDLLGRLLTFCDPDRSSIAATTAQIDQLSYRTGVTAAGVLEELVLHEPDFLWEILESGTNGKHVFNYRAWPPPTEVRYEISTADGYSAPGGDDDLCNRVTVDWVDATKDPPLPMVTVRTANVQTLTDAGIIRDAERVALPEGGGSLSNARRVGDAVLAARSTPPRAATAVVDHRILDMATGQLVYPTGIRPGHNVRVRETGDVLRLTEVDVDVDAANATLTLGKPVATPDEIIARLVRVR